MLKVSAILAIVAGLAMAGVKFALAEAVLYPFISGGVNWGSGTFDAQTQTLFVNTNNAAGLVRLIPRETRPDLQPMDVFRGEPAAQSGTPYVLERALLASPLGAPCNPPPFGQLHAIDMNTGDLLWQRPLGTLEDTVPLGDVFLPHGAGNIGGPLVTAGGVVFIGATMDNYLRAFDAADGRELWRGRLPAGGQATPMTYMWQGRQYVVIAAGGHSVIGTTPGDTLVAFALDDRTPAWLLIVGRQFERPTFRWLLLIAIGICGSCAGLAMWSRRFQRARFSR